MSIYGIDMGHPNKCGAYGIMSETDGNRAIGKLVISKLKSLGHTVIDCTYDINENELANRVKLANAQPLDFFLSIHMDSFKNPSSNGVTIYTTENSSAKSIAVKIINEVANSCGYYNRGWKSANFYVLKYTNCPACLIECGFVTNQEDCNKFNAEKIANAIVKGITGQSVNNSTSSVATDTPISITKDTALKQMIASLQYDLNLDYNAKLSHTNGDIYQETLNALNGIKGILVKGHKSSVVLWLKQRMIKWSYCKYTGAITNEFDSILFQGITELQKNWNRSTSGIMNLETWSIFLNNK